MTRFFLFLISLSLVMIGSGCRKSPDQISNSHININLNRNIDSLDPAISYDTVSAEIVYQGYESLLQYHYLKRPYTLEPLLAEDLPTVENGGRRYIFTIKKNVIYHPNPALPAGRTVIAQDFINQIKRLAFIGTRSNGWFLFDQKIKGLNEFREKAGNDLEKLFSIKVEGLIAQNDHTLIIDLIEPYPQLLYALAMSFTAPMPEEAIRYYKNNLSEVLIGTGPYELKNYTQGLAVEMSKFENYHLQLYPNQGDRYANDNNLLNDAGKKLPFIDTVKYHIIKEDSPRWLNFKSGNLDILMIPKDNFSSVIGPSGDLSPELKKLGISLQVSPTLTYWWLSFDMRDPFLGKNKKLRMAIAHAINFDRFIELFTNNTGQRAFSIYPPGIAGYSPSNKLKNDYDPEQAKKLFKEAGFPEGKGLPIFDFDLRANSSTSRQMADFIKMELGKIGISVNPILNTFPTFLKKAREGNLQFWLDGWALDYPDAENILHLLHSNSHPPGPNSTYFANDEFDKIFEKMRFLPDSPKKFEYMTKMEEMVVNELPWIMLYYERRYILHYNRVKNYRYSGIVNNYLKYLRITSDR